MNQFEYELSEEHFPAVKLWQGMIQVTNVPDEFLDRLKTNTVYEHIADNKVILCFRLRKDRDKNRYFDIIFEDCGTKDGPTGGVVGGASKIAMQIKLHRLEEALLSMLKDEGYELSRS